MTSNNRRPKYLKIVVIVLALLLASGNVLLTSRGTSAQGIDHLEVVQDLAADLIGEAGALGRGMAEHLHEIVPELAAGDRELFEETRASCEANIAQVLRLIKRGKPATDLVLPPEAAAFVHGVVRRGYPLPLQPCPSGETVPRR